LSRRLTRGTIAAIGVALVTLAAVVVFAGVVARGWWRGEGGSYTPKRAVVHTSVTPSRSLFAQRVVAQADVVVDPRAVDPHTVQLEPHFRPFRVRAEERHVLNGLGRATIVRFSWVLQCMSRACVPSERDRGATEFRITPTVATARTVGGQRARIRVLWPTFGVQSRLTDSDIALSTPQIDAAFDPTPVSYAVSPALVGGLAVGLASLLVLGAGWLVATVVRRDARPLRSLKIPANLSPVERALVLAEVATSRGEIPESRKALERLAAELRRRGGGAQAGEAEQLAWSATGPSEETVAELAAAVRSNGAR
jgi:hypothetical protein